MEYTLILNDQDLAVLNTVIAEMPYKLAAPLVNKINQQIMEQKSVAEKKVEEPL